MPTILKVELDASDFEKERNRVVDGVKELQAKTAQTNSVSVKVDPSDMSDVSDVSDKVEELEGTHEVKVNVKTSGAEKLPKSIAKAKDEAGGLVDQLKKSSDGADMLGDLFLGAGGKLEILKKGIESVGKIILWACGLSRQAKKDAEELAREYAQQKAEISAAADAQAQKTNDIITQMRELNAQEKLSNVQKAKMLSLVDQMGGMYKKLGIEVDAATGKIKNLDDVAFAAQRRGINEQIRAKEAELNQWRHTADSAKVMRDTAGVPIWFGGDRRIGGEADIKEAGKTITDAQNNMGRLRAEISELRRKLKQIDRDRDAAHRDRIAGLDANIAAARDKAAGARQSVKDTQAQLYHDERVAMFGDSSLSYQDRRSAGLWLVGQSEKDLKKLQADLAQKKATLKDIPEGLETDFLGYSLVVAKREQDIAETERLILLAQKKLADRKKQLANLDQTEADRKKAEEDRKKAEEDRKKAEEDRQKAGIKGYFVGQVRQDGPIGHVEQALKDARAAKGADLTDEESEAVRKIAKLTYSMNNRRENDPGDLSIKTNSLTARGGFQGGAVAPDLERYNRITAENSRQTLARMRTLETNVAKILRIFEG